MYLATTYRGGGHSGPGDEVVDFTAKNLQELTARINALPKALNLYKFYEATEIKIGIVLNGKSDDDIARGNNAGA